MLGTLYADCRTTLMPNTSCWHTASYPRGGAPTTVVYSTKVGYWNDSVWCNHTASNVSMGYNTPMSPPKADFLSGGNRFGQAYLLGLWESHVLVNDYLFLYPKSPRQLHGSGKKKKKKRKKTTQTRRSTQEFYTYSLDCKSEFTAAPAAEIIAMAALAAQAGVWLQH